ncbi:MAG: M23 family metallopeptidase [Candidatus Hydrogenedentes bacterium]|nr:M23 family metallopeptidase [Candidatus Hydrogenedentota bacterium]
MSSDFMIQYTRKYISVGVVILCILLLFLSGGCARVRHRFSRANPFSTSDTTPSLWPVDQSVMRISSPFGERRSGGRRHKGIDMAAPQGTAVMATASGHAVLSGQQGAYGNIIVIRHGNDLETAYAHLHRRLIRQGDTVRRGQKIGTVGATGNATGPHLHYEVRRNGVRVDPGPWLP